MATTTIFRNFKPARSVSAWREAIWERPWLGALLAMGIAMALGDVSRDFMPRGPVTTDQALLVIATSLLMGVLGGYLARTRWVYVLVPLGYIGIYEIARLGLAGATNDFRLDSVYGIAAFLTGRGLQFLLAIVPMLGGLVVGRWLARPRGGRHLIPPIGLGILVGAIAVAVVLPATIPPVLGADGQTVPGSIAELTQVELGGTSQTISIRAADANNPVLLYLSGGPGQSDIAFARVLLEPLVADYVVVVWDQRGSGKSYSALEPTSTYTLDSLVADTNQLADYLRTRFDEQKIYLLGESWGSTLGVLAVQQRPDLYYAYIGSGQMVSQRVTDQRIWRDLLAYADRTGDGALYDQILSLGEPPYRDMPWANSLVMGYYGLIEPPYSPPAAYVARGEASGVGMFGLGGSEYSFVDNANLIRGLVDMFSIMYPQLQSVDFRTDVPSLDVPVYLLDGVGELAARRDLALEWYASLAAPTKQLYTFENAGHAVAFEQADELHRLLNEEIVPATYR